MVVKDIRKTLRGIRGNVEVEFFCNGRKYTNISCLTIGNSKDGTTNVEFHIKENKK